MKNFELVVEFEGGMFVNVEAETPEEAKEIFLKNIDKENHINMYGNPSYSLENINLPIGSGIKVEEFNIEIKDPKIADIEELDENGEYIL